MNDLREAVLARLAESGLNLSVASNWMRDDPLRKYAASNCSSFLTAAKNNIDEALAALSPYRAIDMQAAEAELAAAKKARGGE